MRNGDARALLGSAVRFLLDERVRDRIIAEMRGNPLALIELPRGLTAMQLAGGFGLLGAQGLSRRIEESFVRRLQSLPENARRLLLVAAAEPVGDPLVLWRAAERLGIAVSAVDVETDGLLANRGAGDVPSSAGALCRVPIRDDAGTPSGPSGPGRGDRPKRRPRPPRVASGHGLSGAQRAGRRGARTVRQPGASARRAGGGSGVPASRGRSVGRSNAAGAACACRCPSELACRRVQRRARAARVGRGLNAERTADGAGGVAPGADRVRVEHGGQCAAAALEGC